MGAGKGKVVVWPLQGERSCCSPPRKKINSISIIHGLHCSARKAAAPCDEDSDQAKGKKWATWLIPNVCKAGDVEKCYMKLDMLWWWGAAFPHTAYDMSYFPYHHHLMYVEIITRQRKYLRIPAYCCLPKVLTSGWPPFLLLQNQAQWILQHASQ